MPTNSDVFVHQKYEIIEYYRNSHYGVAVFITHLLGEFIFKVLIVNTAYLFLRLTLYLIQRFCITFRMFVHNLL